MVFITIFFTGLCMACACAFLIITLSRFGVLDWLESRVSWPFFFVFGCQFCLGFWLSLLFTILVFTLWLPFDWTAILIMIVSTATTQKLLR